LLIKKFSDLCELGASVVNSSSKKSGRRMSKTKAHIAIVDDDESICRAMSRLLRSLGMDTKTFTSGHEFIEQIETVRSFHPDCVVLDVQMPGMNGLEVQELLVRSEHPPPVIFMTGHDEMKVRERALRAGAVAFLRKPFTDEVFVKILTEALSGNQTNEGRA
jgi:FixJ family two-component response regulator